MLVDIKRPLKEGERIPMTLRFENAGEIKVDFEVKELGARAARTGTSREAAAGRATRRAPAMKAEQGMVRIHAQSRSPATPQRTAETVCAAPTPTIAPVMVCVVDTGMPRAVARNSVDRARQSRRRSRRPA